MCNKAGALTAFYSSKDYPATLRRVVVKHDAGKEVPGIKRHIAVDTQGLPHAIRVTTADVTDRAGALAMFERHPNALPEVVNVMADAGYTGVRFAEGASHTLDGEAVICVDGEMPTVLGKLRIASPTAACNSSPWFF